MKRWIKIWTILIPAILMLWGCKTKYVDKPDRLLSKKEMVEILTESYMIQGAVDNYLFGNSEYVGQAKAQDFYASLYKRYGIDHEIFLQNNRYYTAHIDDYYEIMNQVMGNLNDLLAQEEQIRMAREKEEEALQAHNDREASIMWGYIPGPTAPKDTAWQKSYRSVLPPLPAPISTAKRAEQYLPRSTREKQQ